MAWLADVDTSLVVTVANHLCELVVGNLNIPGNLSQDEKEFLVEILGIS